MCQAQIIYHGEFRDVPKVTVTEEDIYLHRVMAQGFTRMNGGSPYFFLKGGYHGYAVDIYILSLGPWAWV